LLDYLNLYHLSSFEEGTDPICDHGFEVPSSHSGCLPIRFVIMGLKPHRPTLGVSLLMSLFFCFFFMWPSSPVSFLCGHQALVSFFLCGHQALFSFFMWPSSPVFFLCGPKALLIMNGCRSGKLMQQNILKH